MSTCLNDCVGGDKEKGFTSLNALSAEESAIGAADNGTIAVDASVYRQLEILKGQTRRALWAIVVAGVVALVALALAAFAVAGVVENADDITAKNDSVLSRLDPQLAAVQASLAEHTSARAGVSERVDALQGLTEAAIAVNRGSYVLTDRPMQYSGSMYEGTGFWAAEPPLPTARSDFHTAVVNDIIFIVGGQYSPSPPEVVDTVEAFDPITRKYRSMPAMPGRVARAGVAAVGNKIYVVGGRDQTDSLHDCTYVGEVSGSNFSDLTITWTTGACLNEGRSDLCAVAVDGRVYAVGGYAADYSQRASVEVYTPATDAWAVMNERLPEALGDVQCGAVDGAVYAMGGINANWDLTPVDEWFRTGVYKLDTNDAAAGWQTRSPMPEALGDFGLVPISGGRFLLVGGETHGPSHTEVAMHNVYMYVPAVDAWVKKAPLDVARFRHGVAYVGGSVYVFGGHQTCNDEGPTPDASTCDVLAHTEVYHDVNHPDVFLHQTASLADTALGASITITDSPAQLPGHGVPTHMFAGSGYWSSHGDMAGGLSDMQIETVDGKIYIFGGADSTASAPINVVKEFDPITRKYKDMSGMPEARWRFMSAQLEGKVYVFGGMTAPDQDFGELNTVVRTYDPRTNSWGTGPSLPTGRLDGCAAAVGNSIVLAGGWGSAYADTAQVLILSRGSNGRLEWRAGPDLPTPRGDAKCAAIGNELLLVGGYVSSPGGGSMTGVMEALDVTTMAWSTLAPLPIPRGDSAVVALPGKRLLVAGGELAHPFVEDHNQVASHWVHEYIRGHDVWLQKASLPDERFRCAAAYADGAVYVFGGHQVCEPWSPENNFPACHDGALADNDVYYDIDHPDLFVHVRAG